MDNPMDNHIDDHMEDPLELSKNKNSILGSELNL